MNGMLSDTFAKWISDLPGFVLVYLALFGVRVGSFQIHGVLTTFWLIAQGIAAFREEYRAGLQRNDESHGRIEASLGRIEARQNDDDKSIRVKL